MKKLSWILAGPLALVGSAMPCEAQTPSSTQHVIVQPVEFPIEPTSYLNRRPRICPPEVVPANPSVPPTNTPPTNTPPTNTPPTTQAPDALPTEGRYKSSYGLGAAVSAGGGIGAAVAAGPAGFPIPAANMKVATISSTPLIMPGLFTAAASQSVIPLDRVTFDYGNYNRFAIVNSGGVSPGFNLNQYGVTVEKTIFDGIGSVYVNAPFLDATQNVSGQQINGIGDVSAGFKIVLWNDRETGNLVSGGLTVAAPTAHPTIITNTLLITFTGGPPPAGVNPPPVGTVIPVTSTTRVNPTYLQPWIGGIASWDKLFVHEYFGVLVPTDSRVATILNINTTFGYNLYTDPNRFIRSITPTFGVQMLLPVSNVNNSTGSTTTAVDITCLTTVFPSDQLPTKLGFPDQVFLSGGAQIGLGERFMLSLGVVTPVVGPRGYAVGGTVGLSYFY